MRRDAATFISGGFSYLLRSHIAPYFPALTIARLILATVRRSRKKLLDNGVSPVTAAKAYRLLRAIMNTAVDDGLIRRNPCRIKGAGNRALILLATFASLRWAELAALRPEDIHLDARTVRVTRQMDYPRGGGHSFGPPKSRAGRRVVSFPGLIAPDLRKQAS